MCFDLWAGANGKFSGGFDISAFGGIQQAAGIHIIKGVQSVSMVEKKIKTDLTNVHNQSRIDLSRLVNQINQK